MSETDETKIKIELSKVLLYSKHKISSGEDDGKLMIARNLDRMKKWTEEEISEIFDDKGNLKAGKRTKKSRSRLSLDDRFSRTDLVRNTKRKVITALKLIFADEDLEDSEMPKKPEYQRMAKELISEENIRNKFEETFVEYNPTRN